MPSFLSLFRRKENRKEGIQMKPGYEQIRNDREINLLIEQGNRNLKVLGYTEHSRKHAVKVAETAGRILKELGYRRRQVEMAKIAGYMHDIGNTVNRYDHAHSSAVLAYGILKEREMKLEDILTITSAIGQHDEETGTAVDAVSAALILADKTDVRRNRVQNPVPANFDIHDRVNYAAEKSDVILEPDSKTITLDLKINTEICAVMDYFEIFTGRMLLCRKAAEFLGLQFKLDINDVYLL